MERFTNKSRVASMGSVNFYSDLICEMYRLAKNFVNIVIIEGSVCYVCSL